MIFSVVWASAFLARLGLTWRDDSLPNQLASHISVSLDEQRG